MKVASAQFMEPVESPLRGPGGGPNTIEKFKSNPEPGKVRARVMGPGIILEVDGQAKATVVPWGNVRFAVVDIEESDAKPAKKT